MRHQQNRGPTLPKDLLSQLGDAGSSGRRNLGRNAAGRKARRKAERQAKKLQKRTGRDRIPSNSFLDDDADLNDSGDDAAPERPIPHRTLSNGSTNPLKSILKKRNTPSQSPDPEAADEPESRFPLSRSARKKLDQDDAEIAELEKKLGIKSKKLPKSFQDDGLDTLLEGLDSDSGSSSEKKRKSAEDKEWLAKKRQKVRDLDPASESDLDEWSDDSVDEEAGESDSADTTDDGQSEDGDFEGFDSDHSREETQLGGSDRGHASEKNEKKARENPYVPPVVKSADTEVKYVPPSLRAPPSSDAEALTRLRRQLQGLLNRLSEANLLTILRDVEQLYQSNPRQYVSSTLADLLLALVSDRSSLSDTFLILHAGFVAAVYKIIGPDFGAQFVERIVLEFDQFYKKNVSSASEKQPVNLVSLLAEMYNFQVIGCNLIFDYIRQFLNEVSDVNTELLLKVVKLSGPQLRQDDPSALKDIVVLLQSTVAKAGEANISVRTKFMVETINNLKNNRMKTGIAASTLVSEHTVRMKKTLGSLSSRNIKGSEPLRVGLDDIHNKEKRGKWWLVGASWREEGVADAPSQKSPPTMDMDKDEGDADDEFNEGTTDLLRLAKEQRMNTDIRRAIFVTIMSATDYRDAHVRLTSLRLKKAQEGEIPRVLLQCAGCETSYNPYYTLIARRLCGDRKLKIAFQFSLWDIFKRMGERPDGDDMDVDDEESDELDTRRVVNLAKMFGTLLAEGSLPVTCLKVLNFTYLQPKTRAFLEVLLTSMILRSQRRSHGAFDEKLLLESFRKVAEAPQMARGLQYFVKKVVSKADIASNKSERETVQLGCRALDDFLAGMEISLSSDV